MKNYHAKAGMRGWAWKWKPSRAWGVGLKTKIIMLKRARGGRNSSVGSSVSSWKARCNTDVGSNPWGCGKGVFSQSQLPLQILLQCLHSPLPAIAGINTGAYVKNPKRWQLNHCLDTGKCCTHWQEWAALTMPLSGHRKMLHTLTGMGSTDHAIVWTQENAAHTDRNGQHWPCHCLDTGKCCTHWQEWAALTMPLSGHRKMLHTLTGMGSTDHAIVWTQENAAHTDRNGQHWPCHCLDTGKCCTHWQEWAALTMPLSGHRKMLHTLTGMGSTDHAIVWTQENAAHTDRNGQHWPCHCLDTGKCCTHWQEWAALTMPLSGHRKMLHTLTGMGSTDHAIAWTQENAAHTDRNGQHWPCHCLDTGKCCTHWQEWAALTMPLSGHRKMLHTLTGMGSTDHAIVWTQENAAHTDRNGQHWPCHCLDTGKCCTHWQEWAALTMPLPGHRKMLHTLTGMGSTDHAIVWTQENAAHTDRNGQHWPCHCLDTGKCCTHWQEWAALTMPLSGHRKMLHTLTGMGSTDHAIAWTQENAAHTDRNGQHWPCHCLDTGKCCTHWQEWAALTMPLSGHRKMLHILTGMGSTALATAVQTATYLWTADHWDWRWADHDASREQMMHYLWTADHWDWRWADHDTSREQTTCYLQRADHWDWW